ncbi:MAG: tetratricopeptide repeat protein [Deltaproteobacteria bacterium]|nr:tetratricopeptide repeat protein [Deltaproteobacteria bacterium]
MSRTLGKRVERVLASALLGVALFGSSVALARNIEEQLGDLETDIGNLTDKARTLSEQVAPGRGFITQAEARKRYEDCVYLFLLGDYGPAAEGFFALVTTASLADEGLHLDAEWYLAESLFQMGNLVTAEARFQVIGEDASHPFREEAVRRLLEMYANTGQTEAFYAYYEQEIVRGRVNPSDLITYTVAKAFHAQGDLLKAKSNLLDLEPESPFYRRARYFLGAVMVEQQELDSAKEYFKSVLDLPVETYEQRQVLDLSLLALGRIYLEQGDYNSAIEYYSRIAGDSDYLADKLYELVWTFIKQRADLLAEIREATPDEERSDEERQLINRKQDMADDLLQEALRGVEIFLLAFPEHRDSAQLILLEGHLHMQSNDYDEALDTYEQVISEYTPIKDRFHALGESVEETDTFFQQVLELERGETTLGEGLPAYATAMMLADSDLSRSIDLYRALEEQNRDIEVSEGLIAQLETVLDSSVGIGGFEQIRYDALLNQNLALQDQLTVLGLEEEWLLGVLSGPAKRRVVELRERRLALQTSSEEAMSVSEEHQTRLKAYQSAVRKVQRERESLSRSVASLQEEADGYQRRLASQTTTMDPKVQVEVEARLAEVHSAIYEVHAKLPQVEQELGQLLANPVGDTDTSAFKDVLKELADLHAEYQAVGQGQAPEMVERFERDQRDLKNSQAVVSELLRRLARVENAELERIRGRFEHEIDAVARERVELEDTLAEAERVAVHLTRAGFGRLEDFFADSVLRADMGIVDAYWQQKVGVADERLDVAMEREALQADLERRFTIIRQKMNQ